MLNAIYSIPQARRRFAVIVFNNCQSSAWLTSKMGQQSPIDSMMSWIHFEKWIRWKFASAHGPAGRPSVRPSIYFIIIRTDGHVSFISKVFELTHVRSFSGDSRWVWAYRCVCSNFQRTNHYANCLLKCTQNKDVYANSLHYLRHHFVTFSVFHFIFHH